MVYSPFISFLFVYQIFMVKFMFSLVECIPYTIRGWDVRVRG